jgi:AcrR family transcriptional regulator
MGQPAETGETAVTRPLSRKRRQTQERLLDAALDAFAEKGFHATSVEEVCERANFSRGAFYSNYSSKTELFVELYLRQAEGILAALSESQVDESLDRPLAAVISELAAAVPHDRRWFLISTEFELQAVRNPAAATVFAAARARVRASFATRITEILERFGWELTVPADILVRWLFALYEGTIAQSYMEPDLLAPHQLIDQVTPLLLAAVTKPITKQGAKPVEKKVTKPS